MTVLMVTSLLTLGLLRKYIQNEAWNWVCIKMLGSKMLREALSMFKLAATPVAKLCDTWAVHRTSMG